MKKTGTTDQFFVPRRGKERHAGQPKPPARQRQGIGSFPRAAPERVPDTWDRLPAQRHRTVPGFSDAARRHEDPRKTAAEDVALRRTSPAAQARVLVILMPGACLIASRCGR